MKFLLTNRFYYSLIGLILAFFIGFYWPAVFLLAKIAAPVFALLVVGDCLLLFVFGKLELTRNCNDRFSNGDDNDVEILVKSQYPRQVFLELIDELPVQFQQRDFVIEKALKPGEVQSLIYQLRPVQRGEYAFGHVIALVTSQLGLIVRKVQGATPVTVKVYPSFVRLHQYELMAISQNLTMVGQKQVRKVGNSREFDTIKDYVMGDDPRKINWAATARRGHLMTNHYIDERAQNVYCVIDKSRAMKMPFDGMSLLDYAINASLVIGDIAMKKGDQAGLVTFEHRVDTFLKANHRNIQLYQIMESLYSVQTSFREPDFAALSAQLARNINQRSLLLLFTNFESLPSMQRQLAYLKLLNRKHLLLVVYFRNTEVDTLLDETAHSTRQIYDQTIARQMLNEKLMIGDELKKAGILSLYTTPKNLNVDVLNKYIEVKTRRML